MKIFQSVIFAMAFFAALPTLADGPIEWTSVTEESSVAFGSIKKDVVGEIHHFETVSGTVSKDGNVVIKIDLASVETYIDIRNERMSEHVFQGLSEATISTHLDMEQLTELKPGETELVDVEAKLELAGIETEIETEMLVARLTEKRVLVTTADFVMISTADLGINEGVDMLMKLAKLPSITRVTPVSIRMVFEK